MSYRAAPTACHTVRSGGRLALLGRAKLRAEMTTPAAEPRDCDCEGCCPPPLTDLEAQQALRHVANADAVAFALGQLSLVSYTGCPECECWVPTFIETTP
ncbi:hypothetical protein ACTXG7_05285 [Mycolicibacterium sp. Dal123E01]|uniref:hypothetical protein n=1 Tax=Mycolicibacterium sp. Dal123E01 TaxID=3457578 RepID=UPI00403EF1C1